MLIVKLANHEHLLLLERTEVQERLNALQSLHSKLKQNFENKQVEEEVCAIEKSLEEAQVQFQEVDKHQKLCLNLEESTMSSVDMILAMILSRSVQNFRNMENSFQEHYTIRNKWKKEFGRLPFHNLHQHRQK